MESLAAPVGAAGTAGDELAPVDAGEPEDVITPTAPAPIFPTEADVVAVTAELLDQHPELAGASERQFTREVQAALSVRAQSIAESDYKGRVVVAREHQRALAALVAPVFPTESHVALLDASIPALTDTERDAVLNAGLAAFVASIAAGEPIVETPEATE